MTTSRVPQVIDYLFATFTAAATLGAAAPPGTVAVYDGPAVTDATAQLVLWVGLDDPGGTGPANAGSSAQTWAGLGHQARNEQLTIYCAAEAWNGTDDFRSNRAAVYAITSAVEDIVRNDSSLGGLVSTPGNAAVTAMNLIQSATDRGALARVVFEITASPRIGG